MLSNKVSIKDLFSTNPGQLLGSKYDSTGNLPDSCSQLPFSQDSQDFMNSQPLSATHSQPCESPGRRFYQRYASKGPLFNKDVSQAKGQMAMTKSSYQQQLQTNKTRARERDERDLLNSVMLTVKESAAEVKIAANAVRDVVQQGNGMTEKQLTQHLQQIQNGLSKHSEAVIKALHLRDGIKEQMAQMQEELATKTMHVSDLEKQLESLQQARHQQIIDLLHKTYNDTAQHISGQLQQMYENHHRQLLKQASECQEHHQAIMQQTNRCQKQLTQQQQAVVQEIKKKMNEDLGNYSEKQEMQYRHCLTEVQMRMKQMQEEQKAQIRVLLHQQMTCKAGANEQIQAEIEQKQTKQLQEMQTTHKLELRHFVQQQMESLWQQQEKQIHRNIEDLWENEKGRAGHHAEQPNKTAEESHPRYELEIVTLKNRYQKEVDEIRARQQQQQQSQYCTSSVDSLVLSPFLLPKASTTPCCVGAADECTTHENRDLMTNNLAPSDYTATSVRFSDPEHDTDTGFSHPTTNKAATTNTVAWSSTGANNIVSPSSLPCHTTLALSTSQPFVSPLLAAKNWTSRNLFGKTNPSPVATVLPQRQVQGLNTNTSNVIASLRNVSKSDKPSEKKQKRYRNSNLTGRRMKVCEMSDDDQWNNKKEECKTKRLTRSQVVAITDTSTDTSERTTRQAESVIVCTYNSKSSTKIDNFDDQPMTDISSYHMRNKAYCNEEPKQIESTKSDTWQSACSVKPLVHSIHTANPFISRTRQEQTKDQVMKDGYSESCQDYDNDYSDSSSSSSPGVTVTAEVFIKRRIKAERKTPPESKHDIQNAVKRNMSYLAGNGSDDLDNFLASPKLICSRSIVESRRELRSRSRKTQCNK